ncbi:MAG: hypothetical protein GYB36_10750 [Alphaproteobacteria bacterium]|nr:hypothetical protein [Alphaproteobacteria bacterium]
MDATGDASEENGGTHKYRRAGLTQIEAQRYSRTLEMREETRRLREASPLGILGWLIWKLVFKGFQPTWMIASILAACAFGLLILRDLGGLESVASETADLDMRIEAAFEAERSPRLDVYGAWLEALDSALDGDLRRRPDLDRFQIWAEAGPYLIGRETLALTMLADEETPEQVDARLRALPPELRARQLRQALDMPLREARAREITPVEQVFMPEAMQARHRSALPAWNLVAGPVEAFLMGQAEGRLDIRSQPGLSRQQAGGVLLYDGVRHLVIQSCQSPIERRARRLGCPQDLPRQGFDPFLLALSAFEAGLVARTPDTVNAQRGAQLVRAAYAAGRLSTGLEADLRADLAVSLPPDYVVDRAFEAELQAEEAFQIPSRYQDRLSARIPVDEAVLHDVARHLHMIAELADASSASLSLRLIEILPGIDAVPALLALVERMGAGAVALHQTVGDSMYEIVEVEQVVGEVQPLHRHGLIASLMSMLIVLLLSLKRIATAPLIRQASRFQGLDAFLCRLLLGRKV